MQLTGHPPSQYLNGSLGTLSMDAVQSGHNIPDNTTVDTLFTALTGWDSTLNYELITGMRAEFDGWDPRCATPSSSLGAVG